MRYYKVVVILSPSFEEACSGTVGLLGLIASFLSTLEEPGLRKPHSEQKAKRMRVYSCLSPGVTTKV